MKNRIVFFGTPVFAAEILKFLIEREVPIAGVVTQPDRPKGRSLQMTPSPVKEAVSALDKNKIPILHPEKASDEGFLHQLGEWKGDLYVVVAYGQILAQKLLSIPPLGCINVHASLLPKYRGAAPIQRAIMAGEKETGVAIQKMVRQLDAGDVIKTTLVPIPDEMTYGELEARLCEASKKLLLEVLQDYEKGIPAAMPQDQTLATYASKIELAEGEIHWCNTAEKIHNTIRAFSPRPGAWCWIEEGKRRLKMLRSRVVEGKGEPGELLSGGVVACGHGAIELIEVVPEGKKAMSGADWLRGMPSMKKFPITPK